MTSDKLHSNIQNILVKRQNHADFVEIPSVFHTDWIASKPDPRVGGMVDFENTTTDQVIEN